MWVSTLALASVVPSCSLNPQPEPPGSDLADSAPGSAGAAGASAGSGGASAAGMGGASAGSGGAASGAGGASAGSAGKAGSSGKGGASGTGGSGTGGGAGASGGAGGSSGGAGGASGGSAGAAGGVGGSDAKSVPDSDTPFCSDGAKEIPCPQSGAAEYGQDGNFSGAPSSFKTSTDTALDNVTGLTWQRGATAIAVSQADAATYCASLTLGAESGFRLPSRVELMTLVDYGRSTPPAIAKALDAIPAPYWSATTSPPSSGWIVDFADGSSRVIAATTLSSVRCVKGAPFGESSFTVSPDALTVGDAATGLTWQRGASDTPLSWVGALGYCQALSLGGVTGFRVPNEKELTTLVQPGKATPAEDSAAFPPLAYAPTGAALWSSTPLRSDPTRAWIIDFATGETGTLVALPSTPTASVRCVK